MKTERKSTAEMLAIAAKELHDELLKQFPGKHGDTSLADQLLTAVMPALAQRESISTCSYRTVVSVKNDPANAEEMKKGLQALVNGIFNRTSSDKRKGML